MKHLLAAIVMLAAILFIAVSAAMNAVFLSSLGRTPLEVGLLAAVSLGGDAVKAVLPVLIMRGLAIRAWAQTVAATLLLLVVTALSLASGTGFAALTRGAATALREAQADALASRRKDLRELETRIALIAAARPASVIEADLAGSQMDRRWLASKSCAQPSTASARNFCTDVLKLKAELAAAHEQAALSAERQQLRAAIERLEERGAGTTVDPQSTAIAELFGIDRHWPRVALTSFIAIILEFGSVVLVLLAAGPMVLGWRDPNSVPPPAPIPATLPVQADRAHWHRQRSAGPVASNSRIEGRDARG